MTSLETQLDHLERVQMVRRAIEPEFTYLFKHALTQEAAYASLLQKRRRDIHRIIAHLYEQMYPDRLDEYAMSLAQHYFESGDTEKSIAYFLRAGELAERTSAYGEASTAFAQALFLTPQSDKTLRAKVLVKLGNVHYWMGDQVAAQELQEGLGIARSSKDAITVANALVGLCNLSLRQGLLHEASTFGEEALNVAREAGDRYSIAWAGRRLGAVAAEQGDNVYAERLLQESLVLSRELDDRSGSAGCLALLGSVARHRHAYVSASGYFAQALEICRDIGDRRGAAISLNELGQVLCQLDDYEGAALHFQEALDIDQEIGQREGSAISLLNLGDVVAHQGNVTSAQQYYHKALAEGRATGNLPLALSTVVSIAALRFQQGNATLAGELLGIALSHSGSTFEVREKAEGTLASLRLAFPSPELDSAIERGQRLDLAHAIDEILNEIGLL